MARSLSWLAAEDQAADQKREHSEAILAGSGCLAITPAKQSSLALCRCEEAAGDGEAWFEHALNFHLSERHQGRPEASVYQLLCLF